MSVPMGPTSSTLARPGADAALRPALIVIGGSSVLACALELSLLRAAFPELAWLLGSLALTGVLYVLAGLLAWDRRPSNRLGRWLVVIGFLILVARLSLVADTLLATIGRILAQAPIAGVVVAMLLFPSGRLASRLDRAVAIAAFVITVGFAIPSTLFRSPDASAAVTLGERPALLETLARIQLVAWWALLAVLVVLLVRRLRTQRAVRGERRARIAVYLTGLLSVMLLPLVAQLGQLYDWNELVVFAVQVALVALVPVVFATALLAGGFGRTGRLDELAGWLGRSVHQRTALRDALATTLGDGSLQLFFRRRSGGPLVDAEGRSIPEPESRAPGGLVEIALSGDSTAVIVYDTAAVPDPQTVLAAGRVVALGLDRDRLLAELLAERQELKRSRARIVEVGDAERRRLARDLHDGLQSRLVLTTIRAGTLAAHPNLTEPERQSAAGIRVELEQAVDELRRLVQGVLPALLLERGLVPAARDLVERCGLASELRVTVGDLPLPPAVASTAYFVLAEAITNAVKDADATRLQVSIGLAEDAGSLRVEVRDNGLGRSAVGPESRAGRDGTGLDGMADRVEALDGTFSFRSQPGQGCVVVAVIPRAEPDLVAA